MRRFILKQAPDSSGRLSLSGDDCHYLSRVLRKKPGDSLRVLDPEGHELLVRIVAVGPKSLSCEVVPEESSAEALLDRERRDALPRLPSLVLLQALPKGQKMDQIVRQAAEAGVALVIPFIAERSVSRPEAGADCRSKQDRWQRIAREARQQSGSDTETRILEPVQLAGAVGSWREYSANFHAPVALFLHQDPLAQGSLHGYLSSTPDLVAIAVGPEGGFSPDEVAAFEASSFHPVLVGPNVLRTETAALFATAAVQAVLLERSTWILKTPK